METKKAADIFKELGHPVRLEIIRELIKYSNKGLAVGELQKTLGIPHSTLSHHLSSMIKVEIISQQREGTTLHCVCNNELIVQVTKFLTEECCIKCE